MRMIAAKWKLWIVILITSLLRVDGAAKLVLTISSYRSNSKKKDRKEGQKLIQGAMIRKDGRRKKKRRDQKNEVDLLAAELAAADFSCPITLSSRVLLFRRIKGFRCRRLFWSPLHLTLLQSLHVLELSKELSLLTSQPKSKTKKESLHNSRVISPLSLILKRFMEELNFWRLAIMDWFWYSRMNSIYKNLL